MGDWVLCVEFQLRGGRIVFCSQLGGFMCGGGRMDFIGGGAFILSHHGPCHWGLVPVDFVFGLTRQKYFCREIGKFPRVLGAWRLNLLLGGGGPRF